MIFFKECTKVRINENLKSNCIIEMKCKKATYVPTLTLRVSAGFVDSGRGQSIARVSARASITACTRTGILSTRLEIYGLGISCHCS